jgi:hypothetical protein
MSEATQTMKDAVMENQNNPAVVATPGGYNINLALFALAEALEGIEMRLDRLEKSK